MESRPRHNLDNPTLRARLRGSRRAVLLDRPHSAHFNGHMSDVQVNNAALKLKPGIAPATKLVSSSDIKPVAQHTSSRRSISGAAEQTTGKILKTKALAAHPLKARPDLPKQKRSNVLRRQPLKPPVYTHAAKHRRPLVPTMLSGLALVLFIAGVLVLITTLRTNRQVKAQVKQLAQQAQGSDTGISDGTPSEADPPTSAGNNSYQVPADLPRLLTIDKINVSARIRQLGIGPNNILKAPANIYDAGWYDGSAKPGENGTIVLDGHVSGPTKHGVFYSIGTLKPGDKLELERGEGKRFTYTVTSTDFFDSDKVDMSKVITSSVPGKPGLNLMTCSGRFNVRTNQFEQRVVVYAVQD